MRGIAVQIRPENRQAQTTRRARDPAPDAGPSYGVTSRTGHDLSAVPVRTAGDLEAQADRVASAVTATPPIRRRPARAGSVAAPSVPSGGQPIEPALRSFMEQRFGSDFRDVRIHADARAASIAKAMRADAFTSGRDIVFGSRRYEPGSARGRRLLAHELAHVFQQRADHAGAVPRVQCQPAEDATDDGDPTKKSSAQLATDITRSLGTYETNRGGSEPHPRESRLRTVAGTAASVASVEQATMPYIIGAVRAHRELRDMADPPLTSAELDAADARSKAVVALLNAVAAAAGSHQSPDAFISAGTKLIAATGLGAGDVRRMFAANELKAKIDAAHAGIAAKKTTMDKALAGIPLDQRLGLDEASLKAYIKRPEIWGENRAAWQRAAVATLPGNIGRRLESIAVANQGTGIAAVVIRSRIDAYRTAHPTASEEEIVKAVAQKNNPREVGYGDRVWSIYERIVLKAGAKNRPSGAEPKTSVPQNHASPTGVPKSTVPPPVPQPVARALEAGASGDAPAHDPTGTEHSHEHAAPGVATHPSGSGEKHEKSRDWAREIRSAFRAWRRKRRRRSSRRGRFWDRAHKDFLTEGIR